MKTILLRIFFKFFKNDSGDKGLIHSEFRMTQNRNPRSRSDFIYFLTELERRDSKCLCLNCKVWKFDAYEYLHHYLLLTTVENGTKSKVHDFCSVCQDGVDEDDDDGEFTDTTKLDCQTTINYPKRTMIHWTRKKSRISFSF